MSRLPSSLALALWVGIVASVAMPAGAFAQLPDALRSTSLVFTGLSVIPAAAGRVAVDSAFANQDLAALEAQADVALHQQSGWTWLDKDASFHADDATEGNVLFVAVVISRAEVTSTKYAAMGIVRHTAWLTISAEFFNIQTRMVYHTTIKTALKEQKSTLDREQELSEASKLKLLNTAAGELLAILAHEAAQRFDPDFVSGQLTLDTAKAEATLRVKAAARISVGQNFHPVGPGCLNGTERVSCKLTVVSKTPDALQLRAPDGLIPLGGVTVFTIGNKKLAPDAQKLVVAPMQLTPESEFLRPRSEFLQLRLHGALAADGNLNLVSPLPLQWNSRAMERFRKMGIVASSAVELKMERALPQVEVRWTPQLKRESTRANDIEAEEAYVAVLLGRLWHNNWSFDIEPKLLEATKGSELVTGKGMVLNRVLVGKSFNPNDLFLVAVEDAMPALAVAVAKALPQMSRRPW